MRCIKVGQHSSNCDNVLQLSLLREALVSNPIQRDGKEKNMPSSVSIGAAHLPAKYVRNLTAGVRHATSA